MNATSGNLTPVASLTQEALNMQRKRRLPIPLRLLIALATLIGIGTGLLLLPWMTTQRISVMEALFTATSAATVTGLAVLNTSTAFTRLGQWVILLLMQVGGLGFVVATVLTLRLLGRRILAFGSAGCQQLRLTGVGQSQGHFAGAGAHG